MLTTVDGATGIKTGYTKQAGRCLSSSVKRGETEYVSVVLNSPDMWNRSQEILNQAFANYKRVKVFDAEEFSSKIRATNKGKKFILYAENDFYYPLTKNEQDGLKYLINGKSIESYVKNPEKEGEIQIFIKNKLIFSQKIFSIYNR
jgi:D-alanyl-D-alanine carboxypeptidase